MSIETLIRKHVIGDPVHGYVGLTDLEYSLLQLPAFMRLHRVRQNATTFLTFPGSLTSRFEHVVGALHMGYRIIARLLNSLDEKTFKDLFLESGENPASERLSVIKSVRLACLCHDLGHGPFSHTAEEIMLRIAKEKPDEVSEAMKLFNIDKVEKIPIHEYYSYKIITTGEVADLIVTKEGDQMLQNIACLLSKNLDDPVISKHPEGFKILRKIISGQLDADRMDYLQRDGLMSGVKYGQVDVERVIRNMVIHKTGGGTYELAIHDRALGSIEDMLDARYKMYRWFYSHHTVMATNRLIGDAMEQLLEDEEDFLDKNIFHWESYAAGSGTDDFILDKLAHALTQKNKDYLFYKGLLDRRYIPISLLKYDRDRKIFEERMTAYSNTQINFATKIREFIKDRKNMDKLKKALEAKGGDIANVHILGAYTERTPYRPLTSEMNNNVWVICDKDKKLVELTRASSYFEKINEVWASSTDSAYYLSYLIPGKTKEESKLYNDEIFELIAKTIAVGLK